MAGLAEVLDQNQLLRTLLAAEQARLLEEQQQHSVYEEAKFQSGLVSYKSHIYHHRYLPGNFHFNNLRNGDIMIRQ